MPDWIESQLSAFHKLGDSNLTEWQVIEMALNEATTKDHLIWHHRSVPMLQLLTLFALVDNQWQKITTSQSDNEFGLSIRAIAGIEEESRHWHDINGEPSIFRWRVPDELPTGRLSSVSVRQNESGNIASVEFQIQDRLIQLSAGEVYENDEGQFEVKLMDESVLVQVDGRSPAAT